MSCGVRVISTRPLLGSGTTSLTHLVPRERSFAGDEEKTWALTSAPAGDYNSRGGR
jgi:hypothetical protein